MLPFTLPDHVSSPILEQFEKHSERHLLACDLEVRARRMMCVANNSSILPQPSPTMQGVWDLLPNDTAGTMSMPLQAGVVLRAPPPTSMDATFAVVDEFSPQT